MLSTGGSGQLSHCAMSYHMAKVEYKNKGISMVTKQERKQQTHARYKLISEFLSLSKTDKLIFFSCCLQDNTINEYYNVEINK